MEKTPYFKLLLIMLLLVCFGHKEISAQQTVPTSGGNLSSSEGSVSFSVGQIVYTTNSGSNGSLAQGVQQPYEISVVTSLANSIGTSITFSAYPNPTRDLLKLNVEHYKHEQLVYQLLDITGKLLDSKKIESDESIIPMTDYSLGIYFVKIIDNTTVVKTFKIIKN